MHTGFSYYTLLNSTSISRFLSTSIGRYITTEPQFIQRSFEFSTAVIFEFVHIQACEGLGKKINE